MSFARAWLLMPLVLATGVTGAATSDACSALRDPGAQLVAETVEAGYCRVRGTLHPVAGSAIGFELRLPSAARWTGRFQMLGNGGYSSAMPEAAMAQAVARGSAVAATDTGHSGDDPDFSRGRPQAIVDWGWRAVHLTAETTQRLTTRFYGRAAAHRYFNGCSTGGHQAMMEAQRFPKDFDGIVAGAPGADRVRLNAAFLWQYLANHRRGDDAHPILDPAALALLADHSLTSCRAANGGKAGGLAGDTWLDDPLTCRPRPAALACHPGEGKACLSPAQVAAGQAMYAGAAGGRGRPALTFPWLPGSERGWASYWADPEDPRQPARTNFWRIWAFSDPAWSWWTWNTAHDLPRVQARLSATIDATNPDLRAFRRSGGRLLQYHGLADPVVSPLDTLAKRRAFLRRTGGGDDWSRLFLVPGMGHCGGGDGFNRFDAQAAIERWVEAGTAPDRLIAADTGGRRRPLCSFPRRAVFQGGDATDPDRFACTGT